MIKIISLASAVLLLIPACGKKKPAPMPAERRSQAAPKKMHKEDLGGIKEIGLEEEVSMPMPSQRTASQSKEDLSMPEYEEAVEIMEEPGDSNGDYDLTVMEETETTF